MIREVPAVREKIGYVDDYLLTKLKYAKYKLLSKILFGKKRVSCRQKRKELKREMKRIKSCYGCRKRKRKRLISEAKKSFILRKKEHILKR